MCNFYDDRALDPTIAPWRPNNSSGANTVGIIVGAVVGVVLGAVIIGAVVGM